MTEININCDVGEGFQNEADLMPYIQSCNIACGGHAGDAHSIAEVVAIAQQNKVAIGAHPSYPDVENFGRVSMKLSEEKLLATLQAQLQLFENVLSQQNAVFHHIKPHGALYNDLAKDEVLSTVFLKAVLPYKKSVALYAPYKSAIARKALQNGFRIFYEAFADRAYNDDLSLVSRTKPNAVLTDKQAVLQQVLQIATQEEVTTYQNTKVPLEASTFCVHSDTENAVDIVKYLHQNKQTVTLG
ncbi:5-oxoprolinase subunit PxpA [Joostella sp. CR20]|uniref:5-oxoprolinase subunit PxpA n=1 Tax=Joostella sp. CR20 TaxID=2804312 RepID=UPI00313E00E9